MAEISKELLEKLTKAEGAAELAKLANENGVEVPEGTENEFYKEIMAIKDKMPLSDDDLDAVAGGMALGRHVVRFTRR